jgi:chromosome segregation ATPase
MLSKEELAKRFGLILPKNYQALEEEREALQADLEEGEGRIKEAEEKFDEVKGELEESEEGFSDKLNELTDLIADALEEDNEDWEVEIEEGEDRAYATLRYGLERLIDDYQAIKAMQEES